MAEFGTTQPRGKPTSRRRRSAFALVFVVMAMIGGLVFVAVQADGRELSRATANDGGAWVVSRELGAVGHMNRATGELSSHVQLADGPTAEVHQAHGIVVVHEESTNLLFEVDQRASSEDVAPTRLPEFSSVIAIDNAVVIYRNQPSLAVWVVPATELSGLTSLEGRPSLIAADGPGLVAANTAGGVAAVETDTGLLHWFDGETTNLASFDLEVRGAVIDVSLVGASVAVLTDAGELVTVGPQGIEHRASWDRVVPDATSPALLQRSTVSGNPASTVAAASVVVISEQGELVEVVFEEEGPRGVVQGSLPGAEPLAPIVHDGCAYAVVTEPPTYASTCDGFSPQEIDSDSSDLTLRLVNGWIWINDLDTGLTLVPDESLVLEELDDWGLVVDSATDDESEEEPDGGSLPATEDTEVIDDPDADGEILEDDEFDAGEVNLPPTAIDDQAQTRTDQLVLVEVLSNDFDPNNDVLAVVEVELLAGDGLIEITPAGTATQVKPAAGFSGVLEYRYAISDGLNAPVSARVTVVVLPDETNQAPVAETDVVPTTPGEPQTINVLANDFDPDGDAIFLQSITSDVGSLRWDPSGLITFTADATTDAGWVELPYVVADSFGAQGEGRVRIQIREDDANQEPDARNDQLSTVVGQPVSTNLFANDIDPDGDPLVIGSQPRLIVSPSNALETANATSDGEFVFVADTVGTYIYTYTVNDAAQDGSESDTARIRVDVLPSETNTPPIAVRDDVVIPIGETRSVRVLTNDGDPDGDVIAIVNWSVSPGLVVTELNDETGHIGFDITLTNAAGPAPEIAYSISDGVNAPVSAPVIIAVAARTSTDQPPLAKDDVHEGRPGQQVEIAVLNNDSDPEGEPLRIVSVGSTEFATVSIAPEASTLVVAIPEDAVSSFSVPYDIEDVAGNRASANLRVQLVPPGAANRPPVARTDEQRTRIDTPVVIDVLDNDSDPDSDPIVLAGIVEQPTSGTARPNVDGSILYTPDASFTGTDVFTYAIIDSSEDSALGQVFIGVMEQAPQNLPPIANDDAAQVNGAVATPIRVLDNDLDPEGDPIRVIDVSSAEFGTVSFDGIVVVYTPPETNAAAATDTFTYVIADSAGNSDDATVTIELAEYDLPEEEQPDDEPDAAPDEEVALEEPEEEPTPEPTPTPDPQELNLPPIAVDDNPPAGEPGALLTVEVLLNDSDPDGDVSDLVVESVGEDAFTDGELVFVTVGDAARQVTYTIVDEFGASASAVINVRLPANGVPEAFDDTPEPAKAGTEITVDVLANDVDPDGDVDELTIIEVGAGARIEDDRVVVTVGEVDSQVEYTIADDAGATASAFINVRVLANGVPVARDDDPPLARAGTEITVDVLANDFDPDGDVAELTIASVGGGARIEGNVVVVEVGDDDTQIPYVIVDADEGEATAFINVRVIANAEPVLVPLDASTAFETPVTLNLGQQVTDPDDDPLFFVCCDNVRGGSVEVDVAAENELVVTFRPDPDFVGSGAFAYTVDDQHGHRRAGSVQVQVGAPDNRAPETIDDSTEVQQRSLASVDLDRLSSDPDDDDLTYQIVTAPPAGASVRLVGSSAELSVDDDIAAGTSGSFTYEVSDGFLSAEGVITYTVIEGENRPPVVSDSSLELQAATGSTVDLRPLTDEPDLGDSVNWSLNGAVPDGLTVEIVDSLVTISAEADAAGTTADIGFTAADTRGGDATGVIAVSVVATTVADPSATDDVGAQGRPQETIEIDVLANDVDPLQQGLTIESIGQPTIGAATVLDGKVIFTTTAGETGIATMSYTIADAAERESTANISIEIVSVPAQPAPPNAVAASQQVTITWATPKLNGAVLAGYRITPSVGEPREVGVQNSLVWDGLENGEDYSFTVTALSNLGESVESGDSPTVTPNQRPEPPSVRSVTSEDESLFIEWDEPTNLGSAIDDYEIRIGGSLVDTKPAGNVQSFRWEPLDNGDNYFFEVRAHNAAGWSLWGPSSTAETPAGIPDTPTIGTTVRVNESGALEVNWAKPVDNNGAQVIEYFVRIAPDGEPVPVTGEDTLSMEWSDLQNGVEVAFQVQARNRAGTSDWSAESNRVKPCGRPAAPTFTVADRDDEAAVLAWTEPAENGCEVIRYWVSAVGSAQEFSVSVTDMDYVNLINGTQYTFTVQAENEQGRSVLSAESAPVIPAGPPIFCPTSGTISAAPTAPGEITVTWDAAIPNGDPIGIWVYQVRVNGGGWQDTNPLSFDSIGNPGPNHLATGLANNTTYTFEVRARNTVDFSPTTCGPVSARTWALPNPMTMVVSYDTATQGIDWTMGGGGSPDTPVTSAQHTTTKDGAVFFGPFVGAQSGPGAVTSTVAEEDGVYSGTTRICNAVGCVDGVGNSVTVVVPKPPDPVTADQIVMTEPFIRSSTLIPGTSLGYFMGVELAVKITMDSGAEHPPTTYEYEVQRAGGASGGWNTVGSGTADFTAIASFPWSPIGRFDPLIGYSDHPNGVNNGQVYTWRVRVKAINDAGEAAWSAWVEEDADRPGASVQVYEIHRMQSCDDAGSPPSLAQCFWMDPYLYGFPPGASYSFGGGTGSGFMQSTGGIPGAFAGCLRPAVIGSNGIALPDNVDSGDIYCSAPRHSDMRIVTSDGYTSQWFQGVPN